MTIPIQDFVFTGRGSTGLWAILKSLNLPNSKILIPVNICEIIIPVIYKAGMIPVYYDVDEVTGIANYNHIIDAYQGDELALLAVHNFGIPLDIEEISAWTKERNIFLIEDVCNAIGATYKKIPLGLWGDAAIYSFGYAKIVEYGVGGAILIRDRYFEKEVLKTLDTLEYYSTLHKNKNIEFQARLRDYRKDSRLQTPSVYCPLYSEYANFLLYNIPAKTSAEIKKEIKRLDKNLHNRAKKAFLYRKGIHSSNISHIEEKDGQVYWRYNLLVAPTIRQSLIDKIRTNNLLVSTWYPPVIGLFEKKYAPTDFAGSYSFSEKIINLFLDHRVSENEVLKMIELINNS